MVSRLVIVRWLCMLTLLLRAAPIIAAEALVQPEILKIPMKSGGAFGASVEMVTHLYKPQGAGPFPVIIFSHGRSGERDERWNLKTPVLNGHGNFWLRKGFAVVASVRPGYGDTGGVDREASGATGVGSSCRGTADFMRVAKLAGEAVWTTFDWLKNQSWSNNDKVILVGNSVGGLTSIGVAAMNPPGVIGAINFSGGHGGAPDVSPGKSCQPDKLIHAFEQFGKTIKVPSLWLYAENDLYWGAEAPKEWHSAFAAGGSKSKFVMTEAVPNEKDGHRLLAAGGKLWSPHVNQFVKELGF